MFIKIFGHVSFNLHTLITTHSNVHSLYSVLLPFSVSALGYIQLSHKKIVQKRCAIIGLSANAIDHILWKSLTIVIHHQILHAVIEDAFEGTRVGGLFPCDQFLQVHALQPFIVITKGFFQLRVVHYCAVYRRRIRSAALIDLVKKWVRECCSKEEYHPHTNNIGSKQKQKGSGVHFVILLLIY